MFDKTNPTFWKNINVNNIISLKDEQGIEDSMEEGLGINGLDYRVKSVKTIKEVDNLCTWMVYELKGTDQDLYLVAKIVDTDIDLGVYFNPIGLASGGRDDLLNNGLHWLFQEPESEDFDLSELVFTEDIYLGDNDEFHYGIKPQGRLFGKCSTSPSSSGIDQTLVGVVEYSCGSEGNENPEFLILEEGEIPRYLEDEDFNGGWVSILMGARVRASEVDVL